MSAWAAGGDDGRDLTRWAACFALVLGLHAAALAALVAARGRSIEAGEALPALMVDLAPPPAAPNLASADAPPAEASPEAAMPDPTPDAPPDTPVPEFAPPPQPAAVAETPPDQVPAAPAPDAPPPEVVVQPKAEAALPRPAAKPKPTPPKPKERVVDRRPAKPVQAKRAESQEARRPPAEASGARTRVSVASASSGASAASRSSWQGALVAALNRAKRPQTETGSAAVRFAIDRGGRILSASLASSAGAASLDQEAVALVRRANLPPAPADVPGATFTFTIPIRFTTR